MASHIEGQRVGPERPQGVEVLALRPDTPTDGQTGDQ